MAMPVTVTVTATATATATACRDIISLGGFCITSQALKDLKLKDYSCPFDWIFAFPSMVLFILKDDFKGFLDRSKMISIENKKTSCKARHSDFPDQSVVFNHHNPKEREDHHAYYTRCVQRFREAMSPVKTAPVHLIMTATGPCKESIFQEIYEVLCAMKQSKEAVRLLVIHVNPTPPTENADHVIQEKGEWVHTKLWTQSGSSGLRFNDNRTQKAYHKIITDFINP